MRNLLRLVLAASSVAVFVVACSTSDTPGPGANDIDSGGSAADSGGSHPDSSTTLPDGATPDARVDASTSPDAATAFTLTSTAFVEGASIPAEDTCDGTNVSPPFVWTTGPAGTKSYGVVLTDKSNNLIHSVIYDIPASILALPAGVQKAYAPTTPAGAHQTKPGFGGGFGYAGPCPPVEHVYEFALYALDVGVLPGADMTTTTPAADALIKAHSLGSTKLTGKYQRPL